MPGTHDESRGADAPRLSAPGFLLEFARTHSRAQVVVCAVAGAVCIVAAAVAGAAGLHDRAAVYGAVIVAACYVVLLWTALGSERVQRWIVRH